MDVSQDRLRMAREDEMAQKWRLQTKVRLEMEEADRAYKQAQAAPLQPFFVR